MKFPLSTINTHNGRLCGECQACCTIVGVHELEKPEWQRCQHQCDKGCGIYEQRPPSCQSYYCLWQAGFLEGDERRRPDKLGIIFDFRVASKANMDVISAWEVWEGAADQQNVKFLLEKIGTKFVIVIRRYDSGKLRLIGPLHLLQQIDKIEIIS